MHQDDSGESQALTQPERVSVGLSDGLTDEDLIAGGFHKVQALRAQKLQQPPTLLARSGRVRKRATKG